MVKVDAFTSSLILTIIASLQVSIRILWPLNLPWLPCRHSSLAQFLLHNGVYILHKKHPSFLVAYALAPSQHARLLGKANCVKNLTCFYILAADLIYISRNFSVHSRLKHEIQMADFCLLQQKTVSHLFIHCVSNCMPLQSFIVSSTIVGTLSSVIISLRLIHADMIPKVCAKDHKPETAIAVGNASRDYSSSLHRIKKSSNMYSINFAAASIAKPFYVFTY